MTHGRHKPVGVKTCAKHGTVLSMMTVPWGMRDYNQYHTLLLTDYRFMSVDIEGALDLSMCLRECMQETIFNSSAHAFGYNTSLFN